MRISDWSSDVCSSDLGQRDSVVEEREREILPCEPACPERDLKRKRHRREAVTEEDKVRRAAPHVGSARRRHRDVGGRNRRRVVEPLDQKSVVLGEGVTVRVNLGSRRLIKKNRNKKFDKTSCE